MTFRKSLLFFMTLSMLASLVACGGGSSSSSTPPPGPAAIAVSLSAAPTTVFFSNSASIAATVTNDSANAGVTWSCAPAASCGTFSSASTLSGVAMTYTAPATAPSSTVVITATSVTDSTKSASTPAITIAASGITVSLGPPPPSLPPHASTAVSAVVSGDSANNGVTWSCTPASTCGAFAPGKTASAVNTTYSTSSTTGNIVITATSVSDTTQRASATVTVTTAALGTLTPGNYVFSLSGTDTSSAYTVSGVFTVDGLGVITGGEQDLIDPNFGSLFDSIVSGTVTSGASGNLQITLITGDASINPPSGNGTEILDAAPISSSKALITEFDNWATSSGTLDLQAGTLAAPSGGYAFSLAFPGNFFPLVMGGVINVDSAGSISGNGSVFDIDIAGNVTQNQSFDPSTVIGPDTFGRVTFALFPSGESEISLAGYMIDANHIRLVEITDSFTGIFGGNAVGQGNSTGTFNANSFSGSNYVFGAAGLDINGSLQEAGLLTPNADGSVSGIVSFNDFTLQTPQGGSVVTAPPSSYTVDPTGRVTITGLTDSIASFTTNLQLYLTGDGHALVVSMDNWNVVTGPASQQTGAGSFTGSSFTGVYAANVQQLTQSLLEYDGVGQIWAFGGDNFTGSLDLNEALSPTLAPLPVTAGFTANSNGVFVGTTTGLPDSGTTTNFTYYLVDPTNVIGIETDSTQLTLGFFELQQ